MIKIAKLIISTKLLISCFYSCRSLWFTNFGTHNGAHFQSVKQPFFSITSQLYISTFLYCDLWHCRFPLTINPFFNKTLFYKCNHNNCFWNKCIEEHWKIRKLGNEISIALFNTISRYLCFISKQVFSILRFFIWRNTFVANDECVFCAVVNLSQKQRYFTLHIIAKSVNTAFCKSFETVADNNRLIKRATIWQILLRFIVGEEHCGRSWWPGFNLLLLMEHNRGHRYFRMQTISHLFYLFQESSTSLCCVCKERLTVIWVSVNFIICNSAFCICTLTKLSNKILFSFMRMAMAYMPSTLCVNIVKIISLPVCY